VALDLFTQAIAVCTAQRSIVPVELHSNRSAVLVALTRYDEALEDADRAIATRPEWPKGHSRRGNALHAMCKTGVDRWNDARAAYGRALQLDPNNDTVKRALEGLATEMAQRGGDRPTHPQPP
jgi:tetratricopeptide (TPR) repeat protein